MKQNNDILFQAQNMKEELIRIRRHLHSRPELGFEEIETAAFIANYLTELGLEVKTGIATTGVTAVLKGNLPGNTIALRADMDALPVMEAYESEYKSKTDGKMHACGHDTHMTMLLGAAKLLVQNKDKVKGMVKFIFQPAEEGVRGARRMIAEGVLHHPEVDAALALHILPDIESGSIEVKDGIFMSSVDEFEINILGKGGHGSNPQITIDPIVTGAQLVNALQTIVSRKISPVQPSVVSVCQFIAGTKSNTIPQTAYLSGTIRCQDLSVRQTIFEQIDRICRGICSAAGADYTLKINEQVPVTVNDTKLFHDFVRCSSDILEKDKLKIADQARTYSEDFSLFGEKVPAMFFFLGTRNEQKDCIHSLHSPDFKIDEEVLPLGTALFTNYCLNREG